MRVLFVASEIYPYVKTGGLGDVAAALPDALFRKKVDVRLLLPGYSQILNALQKPKLLRRLHPFFGREDARLLAGVLPNGLETYVIDCPSFYARSAPYGDETGADWADNYLRFAALSQVAADLFLYDSKWQPDIVHGHDWQCGLMPAYLHLRGRDRPRAILTIHNIAYQGIFPSSILPEINLPDSIFNLRGVEFYGKVGFLKAGLQYADYVTTVSPTYAREIQTPEFGSGLDGLLRERAQNVAGILNGIDDAVWNPKTDANLPRNYDFESLKNKAGNRKTLLDELGLKAQKNMPVFSVISRLVEQKGLDLLVDAITESLDKGASLVVLGSGDKAIEAQYKNLAATWPKQVFVTTEYNEILAHKIIGGADAVIIPSRFEPCGLVQLYGLRYGTLPVVRQTGGLADTVQENEQTGTGFVFNDATVKSLSDALARVCALYRTQKLWQDRQAHAMAQDFKWSDSAKKYSDLYETILENSAP